MTGGHEQEHEHMTNIPSIGSQAAKGGARPDAIGRRGYWIVLVLSCCENN